MQPAGTDSSSEVWVPLRVGVILSPPSPLAGGATSGVVSNPAVAEFCSALSDAMGVEVSAGVYPDYLALLDAMTDGHVDLAWLPPVLALRAASKGKTVPVALPVREALEWFSAALFTREGSPIGSLQDLSSTSVAWVDPQSASGYLVIRAWMRSLGIDLRAAFGKEHFLGSHDAVVEAVLRGAVEVGATYAHLGEDMKGVRSAGWGDAKVRVLALAGPIPSDVVAASVRLPVPVIRFIRDVLVHKMTDDLRKACRALFNAEGFVAAESEHMAPLVDLLNHFEDGARRHISGIPPSVR